MQIDILNNSNITSEKKDEYINFVNEVNVFSKSIYDFDFLEVLNKSLSEIKIPSNTNNNTPSFDNIYEFKHYVKLIFAYYISDLAENNFTEKDML